MGPNSDINKNNTLEINPQHPIIVKLNQFRKKDPKKASMIAHQILDNVLVQSAIPFNVQESTTRNLELLREYLQLVTERQEAAQPEYTIEYANDASEAKKI